MVAAKRMQKKKTKEGAKNVSGEESGGKKKSISFEVKGDNRGGGEKGPQRTRGTRFLHIGKRKGNTKNESEECLSRVARKGLNPFVCQKWNATS